VSRECSVPMYAVAGIFARENGQGLFFSPETAVDAGTTSAAVPPDKTDPETTPPTTPPRPKLQIVK